MLAPDERHLFLQALRPPEGYSFDSGIGTTFTLDLYSLLIAPLTLAFLEYESPEQALQDPLMLMESLRRYSSRLSIFCQAGYINVPAKSNLLISFLEKMVVEVRSPRGGVFHPKFWLLRFTAKNQPVIYRLLNLTRNLTFDRSWDLMVSLEGEVVNRKKGFGRNRPVADFLHALPNLARHNLNANIANCLEQFQTEVMYTNFQVPEGFAELGFHPIGIPKYSRFPFPNHLDRLLVISPFLSNTFLAEQTQHGDNHILVSRVESLDNLSKKSRKRFKQIFVLDDQVEQDGNESEFDSGPDTHQPDSNKTELSGLHAKLFVWEQGWDASWIVGSANATSAAFQKNVEFMIELQGKKSRMGIDTILGNQVGRNSLMNLLRAYPEPEASIEPDPDQKSAEELADHVRTWLVNSEPFLEIGRATPETHQVTLNFTSTFKPVRGKYTAICWPITIDPSLYQSVLDSGQVKPAQFDQISLTSLTSFVAFEITTTFLKNKHTIRFVLNLPVIGMPDDRDDTILSTLLSDHAQFMRYLRLLLLAGNSDQISEQALMAWRPGNRASTMHHIDSPLLEELVMALSRSNAPGGKMDQITDLVARLKRTPQGQKIIPAEFDALWETIQLAREKLQ